MNEAAIVTSPEAPPRTLKREIVAFLVTGGICALLNVGAGTLVRVAFGVEGHAAGVAFGFVVGTVASFVLNRTVTFAAKKDALGVQAFRFALLAATGILLAIGVGEGAFRLGTVLVGGAVAPQVLASAAHVVAIGVTTIYNFLGMKFFALRR